MTPCWQRARVLVPRRGEPRHVWVEIGAPERVDGMSADPETLGQEAHTTGFITDFTVGAARVVLHRREIELLSGPENFAQTRRLRTWTGPLGRFERPPSGGRSEVFAGSTLAGSVRDEILMRLARLEQALAVVDAKVSSPARVSQEAEVVAEVKKRLLRVADADAPRGVASDLEGYLAQVQDALILAALGQARGNKAYAARLLGVKRPTFAWKLRAAVRRAEHVGANLLDVHRESVRDDTERELRVAMEAR